MPVEDMDKDTNSIIDYLENGEYLISSYSQLLKNDVRLKIEEFTRWLDSIATLSISQSFPGDLEATENLKYSLKDLRKSVKRTKLYFNRRRKNHVLTCNVCKKRVILERECSHEHFEYGLIQPYMKTCDSSSSEKVSESVSQNGDSSINDSVSESSSKTSLPEMKQEMKSNQTEILCLLTQEQPEVVKPSRNDLNNFRFNFVITYDPIIEDYCYPELFVKEARNFDHLLEHTMQVRSKTSIMCLLCCCIFSRNAYRVSKRLVQNHAKGRRHLQFALSKNYQRGLAAYHDFWHRQDVHHQAQQIHFIPDYNNSETQMICELCGENQWYYETIQHVEGVRHRNNVVTFCKETNLNVILELQLEGYLGEVNRKNRSSSTSNGIANVNTDAVVNSNMKIEKQSGQDTCEVTESSTDESNFFISKRYANHLDFFEKREKMCYCKCCNVNFTFQPFFVQEHILTDSHKRLSGKVYVKYRYFCEICKNNISNEKHWIQHLITSKSSHDRLPESRKKRVAEYECQRCRMVIYGDHISVTRHISSTRGSRKKNKISLLATSIKKLFRSLTFIEEEAERLQVEAIQLGDYEGKIRECCEDLEKAVYLAYPKCKAYPFGSRLSGLGRNQSDFDMYLDVDDMYVGNKNQDAESQERIVKECSKILKLYNEQFRKVVAIGTARTPIVKFHHSFTNMDCDVSFRHGLGVENTKFLKYCLEIQPITQKFILLLKKWADYCEFKENITNYAMALMAIFYFQISGHLLSLKDVRNFNPRPSVIIDGWETIHYSLPAEQLRRFVTPYEGNLKELLHGFFCYYRDFNYEKDVVCPLLGHTVLKSLFTMKPDLEMCPEMRTYFQKVQNNGELFRLTAFCIQDPFDLSHNVVKNCCVLDKWKELCAFSSEFLETIE